MKSVKIKVYGMLFLMVSVLGFVTYMLYQVAMQSEYVEAANLQSTYKLNVTYSRGMIYDCNMNPLVNQTVQKVASIAPTIEVVAYLNSEMAEGDYSSFSAELESGKPFLLEVDKDLEFEGIEMFNIPVRYSTDQLASHIIGYLDSEGNGVAGAELAMNDVLGSNMGEISVYYQVDAMGRAIAGEETEVVDTVEENNSGVVLTLDGNIQRVTEEASEKLGVGAVVVTEVPNCEIRALASVPDYSPNDIGEVALSEDAPLVNRAFSAYAAGSIFKLASAAEQIERNEANYEYECTGSIIVDGMEFHCYNGTEHGMVNLESALEKSCNCYFIDCVSRMGGQSVLKMAYNMGMGSSTEFGRGLYSSAGNIPPAGDLLNERALANFSIGQGSLTVTPLQVAGMINSIASYGEYTSPKLIAGLVDDDLNYVQSNSIYDEKVGIMKVLTANKLQQYMETTVKTGTAAGGSSEMYRAGAKTGTAQTGFYEGEDELNHYWYAGYIKDLSGKPRYCITVFRESAVSDGGVTAEVFQEIAEYIAEAIF